MIKTLRCSLPETQGVDPFTRAGAVGPPRRSQTQCVRWPNRNGRDRRCHRTHAACASRTSDEPRKPAAFAAWSDVDPECRRRGCSDDAHHRACWRMPLQQWRTLSSSCVTRVPTGGETCTSGGCHTARDANQPVANAAYAMATCAASLALLRTSWMLLAKLSPPVNAFRRSRRNGVTSLPVMSCERAS